MEQIISLIDPPAQIGVINFFFENFVLLKIQKFQKFEVLEVLKYSIASCESNGM